MAHSLRRVGHEPEGAVDADDAKITMSSSQIGYWQSSRVTAWRPSFVSIAKDDKKPKQIARDMMRMTLAIDKDSFEAMTSSFSLHYHRQCRNPRHIE